MGRNQPLFVLSESRLRELLKEYRTIHRRIEFLQRQAKGDDLPFEPSITIRPQARDMMVALRYTHHGRLSEGEQELADAVGRNVTVKRTNVFYQKADAYASQYRVADELRGTYSDDAEEDEKLQLAYNMLAVEQEERTHMTETERLAYLRAPYIESARQELPILIYKRDAVGYALEVMKELHHDDYVLLWYRDVLGYAVCDVCEKAHIRYPREVETYNKRIRRAREEIAKWLPAELLE